MIRSIFLYTLIFTFTLNRYPFVFSEELIDSNSDSTINLDVGKDYFINIKDVSKYVINDTNFAKITILKDKVIINAIKAGQITLFLKIKDSNEFLSYNLVSIRKVESNTSDSSNNASYNMSKYASMGSYNTQLLSIFSSDPAQRYQIFNNFFNYYVPFEDDSSITIRANNLNKFFNFQKINDINLQNLDLLYSNKNYIWELGNINARNPYTKQMFSPLETFGISVNNLKGLKYSQKMDNFNYSVFSGIESNTLVNYTPDSNVILRYLNNRSDKSMLDSGVSLEYQAPFETSLYTSFLNNTDVLNSQNTKSWLFSGFRNKFFSNSEVNASLVYNFNSFGYFANGLYNYQSPQTKDEININANLYGFSRDFFSELSPSRNNYNFNINLKKYPYLTLGGGFILDFFDNQFSRYSVSLNSSYKPINEVLIYASGNSNSFIEQNSKNTSFQLGSNWSSFVPINLNYLFQDTDNSRGKFYQNQFNANMQLIKNTYYDLSLLGSFNMMDPYNNPDKGVSSLNFSVTTGLKKINSFNFYANVGYFLGIRNMPTDRFLSGFRANWEINSFNNLFFDISYDTSFKNLYSYNLSTSLSYTYNFGTYIEDAKGNIRGVVFEDLNENGLPDTNEPFINQINFKLDEKVLTSKDGKFQFEGLKYGRYKVYLDPNSLSKEYRIAGASPINVDLYDKEKEIFFPVTKNKIIKGLVYGDKLKSIALSSIRLLLDGQTEYITQDDGYFAFKTSYGKHTVRIDPNSIPIGYKLADKLSKTVNLETEANLQFVFEPIVNMKVKFLNNAGLPLPNTTINVIYVDQFYNEKESVVTTDSNGDVIFNNPESISMVFSSDKLNEPIEITVPSKPGDFNFFIKMDN